MKDQYVGDINDFCKYALLRAMSAVHDGRLVVAWMLTPPDGRSDGGQIAYLKRPERFRTVDPDLFDGLAEQLTSRTRSVAAIEATGILAGASFHSTPLPDAAAERHSWFAELTENLQPRDLVFLDPDNGLAVPSVPVGRRHSAKYLYWGELETVLADGRSACIYQHFPRRERVAFVRELRDRIEALIPGIATGAVGSPRVAFILAAPPSDLRRLMGAAVRVTERLPGLLRTLS